MKNIWKWIKNHYIVSLLILTSTLLLIDISIRAWIMSGVDLKPYYEGAAFFNNITTPIATIGSVVLFVWLTWKQNQVIVSQNLKMNFEEDFKLLAERMNEDIYKLFKDMDGQKFETFMSAITPNTYLGFLSNQIDELSENADFKSDKLKQFEPIFPNTYFLNRTYSQDLVFLNQVSVKLNIPQYRYIEMFALRVITSDMLQHDIDYFKAKIFNILLNDYISFVEKHLDFRIPFIYGAEPNVPITWKLFTIEQVGKEVLAITKLLSKR